MYVTTTSRLQHVEGDLGDRRFATNEPLNYADPTGLFQQGHPLQGGSRAFDNAIRGLVNNPRPTPQVAARDSVFSGLGGTLGNAAVSAFRASNPLASAAINAGASFGAYSLGIAPGGVQYDAGRQFANGRVSASGKSFILNEGIANAKGNLQTRVPLNNGIVDFSAFSRGDVEIAITGSNNFDQRAATRAFEAKYGALPVDQKYTFHHDGSSTQTVVSNGKQATVARMQLVPNKLNQSIPHFGAAADARASIGPQAGSAQSARSVARNYNATITEGYAAARTAKALNILGVYSVARDALQAAGIAKPDYSPQGKLTYHYLATDKSVFTVDVPGSLNFWSSPRKSFVAGPRAGQTETITSSQAGIYRAQAEQRYGRYVPGSLFRDPRFIPGTERRTIPVTDHIGRETGYIDQKGVHNYAVPRGGGI